MKKILALALIAAFALAACACGALDMSPEKTPEPAADTPEPATAKPAEATPAPVEDTPRGYCGGAYGLREATPAPVEDTPEPVKDTPEPVEEANYEITYTNAKTWKNSLGTTWVQVIVEITNTGTANLFLSSGSCDLEDEFGKLVASLSLVSAYPNVLAPGEKGYMYEETTLDNAVEGELKVIPHENVEKAKVELIRFPVSETEISTDSLGWLKMLGRVENNTDEELDKMLYVVAFLYDANNICIGQIFTIISDKLAPASKIGFELSGLSLPDDVTPETVASYTVYAYPLQFQF